MTQIMAQLLWASAELPESPSKHRMWCRVEKVNDSQANASQDKHNYLDQLARRAVDIAGDAAET